MGPVMRSWAELAHPGHVPKGLASAWAPTELLAVVPVCGILEGLLVSGPIGVGIPLELDPRKTAPSGFGK